jgi:Transposase DDE domain
MICSDGQGIPLAVMTETASRHEVKLVEPLLENMTLQSRQPLRLIYDKAADSDPLRTRLKERGIDLICPHKINR